TFVAVAADEPNAPHVCVNVSSGATMPPPRPIAQPTGTFCNTVPLNVLIVTTGRHSVSTAVPTIALISVQTPLTTVLRRSRGVSDLPGAFVASFGAVGSGMRRLRLSRPGNRWNSVTDPPTPLDRKSSPSTGANGLNSVTEPATPPAASSVFA